MCGSDTLTTVVSRTSRNVANITETATIHGFTCGTSAIVAGGWDSIEASGSADASQYRYFSRHAAAQCVLRIRLVDDDKFYRYPLNHFDEVARGIFRRKQTETSAGRGGNAVHARVKDGIAIRIDPN